MSTLHSTSTYIFLGRVLLLRFCKYHSTNYIYIIFYTSIQFIYRLRVSIVKGVNPILGKLVLFTLKQNFFNIGSFEEIQLPGAQGTTYKTGKS